MLTLRIMVLAPAPAGLAALAGASALWNTRQKRRVSSAAALTTVVPSGLWARCSTRDVCPVSSATFAMEGYFQRQSWFWLQAGQEAGWGWQAGCQGAAGRAEAGLQGAQVCVQRHQVDSPPT